MGLDARDLALKYLSKRDRTALEVKIFRTKRHFKLEINDCLDYCRMRCNQWCRVLWQIYSLWNEKGRVPFALKESCLRKGFLRRRLNLRWKSISWRRWEKGCPGLCEQVPQQTGQDCEPTRPILTAASKVNFRRKMQCLPQRKRDCKNRTKTGLPGLSQQRYIWAVGKTAQVKRPIKLTVDRRQVYK